jgi:hypothetical protein
MEPTLRKPNISPCFVYAFFGVIERSWGRDEWMFVKVGVARDVHLRLRAYKTHCPVPFHLGICAFLSSPQRARQIQDLFLADADLRGYRAQGEWFAVHGGPHDHVTFLAHMLGTFYVTRFRAPEEWSVRLQWVISPDDDRIHEIPRADANYLCGAEDGSGLQHLDALGQEHGLRSRAAEQATALGRLIYTHYDEEA